MVRLNTFQILSMLALGLLGWALADLYGPWHTDLTKFNPHGVAALETEMWRDYYDRKPLKMGIGLLRLLREQNGFTPLRALVTAYHASRAAFIFKDGRDRVSYEKALPALRRYFSALCHTGRLQCSIDRLAREELEWWIIHRERGEAGEDALVRALATVAGDLYQRERDLLLPYAKPRARAMVYRSQKAAGGTVGDADWLEVQRLLAESYVALALALNPPLSK